jgi:hypothetical protein
MQPTIVTWILVIFGAITMAPVAIVYLVFLSRPHSLRSKKIMIGEGEDWRDKTHFRSALWLAWADLLLVFPLLISGSIGVILGHAWGYVLWGAVGSISLYINIVLWFQEKEYVYPSRGPLVYFTYYWGFFVYWGALALAYSAMRLSGIEL